VFLSYACDAFTALHDYFLKVYDALFQLQLYHQHLIEHTKVRRKEWEEEIEKRKKASLERRKQEMITGWERIFDVRWFEKDFFFDFLIWIFLVVFGATDCDEHCCDFLSSSFC